MKSLSRVTPSPEQLTIVRRVRPGVEIIRGAAGSGKTTTAILKLKLFILWANARRRRNNQVEPVKALVLTFNKTLRGYIKELVSENSTEGNVDIIVDTFGHWSFESLRRPRICDFDCIKTFAIANSIQIGLNADFLIEEAKYAIGRFLPSDINDYLTCRRDGRGNSPRVDRETREKIINLIISPYQQWKKSQSYLDWNDLAVYLASNKIYNYDIIIADECQDFSANQLRGITNQLAPEGAATFIIDTAQRIYAGGFTWSEIGLTIRPENSHRLSVNYRNTPEVAKLAASLINYVPIDDDGTPPLLKDASDNPKPVLIKGYFSQQVSWCLEYINKNVDLKNESVGFLHPKGWFSYLKCRLNEANFEYVTLTQQSEWPDKHANIALSTLHSAKGLDFDHVFIIGLDKTGFPEGDFELGDDRFEYACRLLSMAIARARKNTIIGYKNGEQPAIISRLDATTYTEISL